MRILVRVVLSDVVQRWLQWGRTFSSADNTLTLTMSEAVKLGFNGAALFQVRIDSKGARVDHVGASFNGAALFQVRISSSCRR